MIHAFDKKKAHLRTNFGEDTKVASILGILKNLPSQLFWEIIRYSCCDNRNLPQYSGEIQEIEFWSRGWKNINRIEPDVFIRFQEFDLIIEAKKDDTYGQEDDQKQWKRELNAYFNIYYDEDNSNRAVYLIALGGNINMLHEKVSIKLKITLQESSAEVSVPINKDVDVYKCNWFSLLNYISSLRNEMWSQKYWDSNRNAVIRLLDDVILGFNLHGVYDIDWLDSMPKRISIKDKSLLTMQNWRIVDGK